jgi:hypothetical protein
MKKITNIGLISNNNTKNTNNVKTSTAPVKNTAGVPASSATAIVAVALPDAMPSVAIAQIAAAAVTPRTANSIRERSARAQLPLPAADLPDLRPQEPTRQQAPARKSAPARSSFLPNLIRRLGLFAILFATAPLSAHIPPICSQTQSAASVSAKRSTVSP